VYHVLNRSVGKMHMFRKYADFEAFQRVIMEAHQRHTIRILGDCVLSNHWLFVVWPTADGELTDFFRLWARTRRDNAIRKILTPWPVESRGQRAIASPVGTRGLDWPARLMWRSAPVAWRAGQAAHQAAVPPARPVAACRQNWEDRRQRTIRKSHRILTRENRRSNVEKFI